MNGRHGSCTIPVSVPDHPPRTAAAGLSLLTALNVLIHASATAAAAVPGAQAIDWHGQTAQVARGHIILKLRPDIPPAALASLAARHGFTEVAREDRIGAHLLAVPDAALERVLAALALDPAVEYAEPDFLRTRQVYATPNDPLYQQAVTPGFGQFALVNTQTDRAWNDPDLTGSKGSLTEVLAVLDTGV